MNITARHHRPAAPRPYPHLSPLAALALGVLATSASTATSAGAAGRPTGGLNLPPDIMKTRMWAERPEGIFARRDMAAPADQSQTVRALIGASPALAALHSWRETLRGRGSMAQRQWRIASLAGSDIRFNVGSQRVPTFRLAGLGAGVAGVGLDFGRIQAGSSAPSLLADRALRSYDATVDGTTPVARDRSQLTWLTARPLERRNANLDLLMARARRDLTPGQAANKQFSDISLWGGRGETALPYNWKMSGEWLQARLDGEDAAAAWNLGANGPLAHPWGVARVSCNYIASDQGFAATNLAPTVENKSAGDVTLNQDIAIGPLSGGATVGLTRIEQDADATATTAACAARETVAATGSTNLRLKLAEPLALTAQQAYRSESLVQDSAEGELHSNITTASHDAGVELKITPAITVGLAAGQTRTTNRAPQLRNETTPAAADAATDSAPAAASTPHAWWRDEDRITLSLRHSTPKGAFGVQVARKAQNDAGTQTGDLRTDEVRLEAERQLLTWLRLRGGLAMARQGDYVRDRDAGRMERRAEALLNLPILGRCELRYSDWDGVADVLAINQHQDGREYGVRYNLGAGATEGGLSLALEYAKRLDTTDAPATWRVGVTYK